jgi:UDP-hydrolysing UDP-N-acetyl-D-glucosamine 2-epimerase
MTSGKRKIAVVVASRANYGRIKATLEAIRQHPDLELRLIVGASALLHRFGKVIDIIEADGFQVDARVYLVVEGENPTTMAKSTGLAVIELATIFENLKPDIVLTVADRYETLATAVAASYMNIPLAHTQGGELTGSIDESVRHAITKLAHLHFPTTAESAARLVKMGEDPKRVFQVGCPSIDAICGLSLEMNDAFIDRYARRGVGGRVDFRKPYLVVLQHPVTTEYGSGLAQIRETLDAVHELRIPTVWLWPNVDAGSDDVSKGIRAFREERKPDFIHFVINLPVEDYAVLINNAACLVGNSSSGIREGSWLGTPVVNIGTRQRNRERGGNVVDVGYDQRAIVDAIRRQMAHGRYPRNPLYGDGTASRRIATALAAADLSIDKGFHE